MLRMFGDVELSYLICVTEGKKWSRQQIMNVPNKWKFKVQTGKLSSPSDTIQVQTDQTLSGKGDDFTSIR